jgi:hypothetical protein
MHKKLEAELVGLAHSILQMKNNNDIVSLHKTAQELYEKLSILKFVNANLEITSMENDESKQKVSNVTENTEVELVEEKKDEIINEVEKNEISLEIEEKKIISGEAVKEIFGIDNYQIKDDEEDLPSLQNALEEEFKDAISADVAANLFEKAVKDVQTSEVVKEEVPKRSLNDALFSKNIQVGLNDRIAFVKYLFDGSQEDFNRVLSQLNSFKSLEEAKSFIFDFVKPDYDWTNKEEFEERLIQLIERKFS